MGLGWETHHLPSSGIPRAQESPPGLLSSGHAAEAHGGDWETSVRSHLVSEHEGDNLQHMEAPLLLGRGAGQEEEQVVHATEVNRPEEPVVDTGIIVDPLSREEEGGHTQLHSGDLPESPSHSVAKATPQTRRRKA